MRYRRMGLLAGGLLALAVLAVIALRQEGQPIASAQAARTWDVTVGTDDEAQGLVTQTYFPSVITVNAGDTVRFNWASFHTVTFLAGGPPPDLLVPGATPGELLAGPAFFPIPAGPTPPTGPYDGRTQVSSGTPQGDLAEEPPFTLTFTQPGSYEYVCMLHPGMTGSVVVLPSGAATPETPAQATARGQAESRAALGMIESFASQVRPAQTSSRGVGATTVAMGVSLPAAGSKLAFLPGNVTIRRGDIVSFFMADVYEIHTVTFTSGATPPEFIEPVFSVEGAPPQLVIRANIAGPVGGTTYRGEGYWNSGILTGGQSTAVTFDAPPGRYEYLCLVHPFMKGTITITE